MSERTKNIIFVIVGLIAIAAVGFYFYSKSDDITPFDTGSEPSPQAAEIPEGTAAVTVGTTTLVLEAAIADEDRQKGLGGRDGLEKGIDGMLFIFDKASYVSIWMKDMRFALDIIWLDKDWKVVDMAENIAPNTYPRSFTPRTPALYVIELAAGRADMLQIERGDTLSFLTWRP